MERAEKTLTALYVDEEVAATDFFNPLWERARELSITRYWSGEDAPSTRQAKARLIWSREALAVRFACHQNEPLVISEAPKTDEKSMRLWERDVCEIFIAPKAEEPERYFEFEAAPTGEWIDLAIRWKTDGRETDWHYNSGMTAAGKIEEGRVLVTMRLPWEAFGQRPKAFELWRANLFRCVGQGDGRGYLAWQPTRTAQPNFHVPQAFGWLRFEE
jgi:alpha-galactosidase